ncbi:MAG: hypothetical protein HFI26_02755 [Lachnospiraceae bacterium]|jgi:hypothetical protein|nr:hypothetical protein [Lachnospiraceae bacterium]
MSRITRKHLLSMTDTLIKANKALKMSLPQGAKKREALIQLLSDCQDSAISIGETMEKLYGEGTETVSELEVYCENLYQMTLVLEKPNQAKELAGVLAKELLQIRRLIEREVPERTEAVFLPYKASMWDSLESIWRAADADPDCDAYVIPIPYYDRDSDGSFREEHYEGRSFPDDVPVTRYDEYDLGVRMPDIIFIHNPYDGGNYVTSVHPYFYSKNLKNFTDKLVYVPYFVLNGEGIEEAMATPSAVLHADYIIAQTERERQDYIRYCSKLYPQGGFEKKVLALGSPKIDKVRSVNRENVKISEEWLERTEGKKVILYNTSLNGLLRDNEAYLKKMKKVFLLFQDRKDVVILWRPHPLMESTLLSMRTELYTQYMDLKKWFQEKDIGIYDDTADMYPAIGISDAYYGDWSSLVWLYRETGKPVMIQDVEI